MASSLVGTLEESISTAFSQVGIFKFSSTLFFIIKIVAQSTAWIWTELLFLLKKRTRA